MPRCTFSSWPPGKFMVNTKIKLAQENIESSGTLRLPGLQDLQEKVGHGGPYLRDSMVQITHLDHGAGMMLGSLLQAAALV